MEMGRQSMKAMKTADRVQADAAAAAADASEVTYVSKRRREIDSILTQVEDAMAGVAQAHAAVALTKSAFCVWARGEGAQRHAKVKGAAKALLNRNLRKGMNSWTEMVAEKARQLNLLSAAANTFTNRGLRAATNSWKEMVAVRKEALGQLVAAGQMWLNQALASAWRVLAHMGAQRAKVKHAARSLLFRHRRRAINGWTEMVEVKARQLALLRAAASTFTNRGMRAGWNSWEAAVAACAAKLVQATNAGRKFINAAIGKAWRQLAYHGAQRGKARRAAASLLLRSLRKGLSSWMGSVRGRHTNLLDEPLKMRRRAAFAEWCAYVGAGQRLKRNGGLFAIAMIQRTVLRAYAAWRLSCAARLRELGLMRRALCHSLRAAITSWKVDLSVRATTRLLRQRALAHGPTVRVRCRWRQWFAYAVEQGLIAAEPKPPLHLRILQWTRARKPRSVAQAFNTAADDKRRCERLFLAPYAALVVRSDGVLFRVAEVRKPAAVGEYCTINLVQGVDEYLLAAHPLPPDAAIERALKGHVSLRVSADELEAPAWPMMVPCFFGGTLALTNGIEVKVVDADFGGSTDFWGNATSKYGAHFSGPRPGALAAAYGLNDARGDVEEEADGDEGFVDVGLRHVKLTLVDGRGEPVGHCSWVDVHELLVLLKLVVVPTCDSEMLLRKRERLEQHRAEQKRLALAALRVSRDEVQSRYAVDDVDSLVGGIDALMRQLDNAAPTPLLAAGQLSHDAPPANTGGGGQRAASAGPVRKAKAGARPAKPRPTRPAWG